MLHHRIISVRSHIYNKDFKALFEDESAMAKENRFHLAPVRSDMPVEWQDLE